MERTLHRQLKELYGPTCGGRSEVRVSGYRIDAVGPDQELIEVQTGPLGPLLGKLARLLYEGFRLRVVKPVVIERRIARKGRGRHAAISERRSPRRGQLVDVFDDLLGVARLLDVLGFRLELLEIGLREFRVPSRGRRGYRVEDRELLRINARRTIESAADLWSLIPHEALAEPFTTRDLRQVLERPLFFAQRVVYCLRVSGAVVVVGKRGPCRLYAARTSTTPASQSEPSADSSNDF